MASADQLKALIKSHITRDDGHFYTVAMQVAAHEAKRGHGKLAEELRDLIDKARTRLASDGPGKVVPLAGAAVKVRHAAGDLAGLLAVSQPRQRLADMVLDDAAAEQLRRVIKEQKHLARIKEFGLTPRRKLLLVGPPGTGKTMTASVLAGELGLPLFVVQLDALITKFMGETAAKLRQVFDAITELRGVYLFDEFDAIGSQRGTGNDVGEIRRVLNSFLQMIEHDQSNSLILAATNHPQILDEALFRRFDDVIAYRLPTPEQAQNLVHSRLGPFAPKPFKHAQLVGRLTGLSYAELVRAVDEAIKAAILDDHELVSWSMLEQALDERRAVRARLTLSSESLRPHAGSATQQA